MGTIYQRKSDTAEAGVVLIVNQGHIPVPGEVEVPAGVRAALRSENTDHLAGSTKKNLIYRARTPKTTTWKRSTTSAATAPPTHAAEVDPSAARLSDRECTKNTTRRRWNTGHAPSRESVPTSPKNTVTGTTAVGRGTGIGGNSLYG